MIAPRGVSIPSRGAHQGFPLNLRATIFGLMREFEVTLFNTSWGSLCARDNSGPECCGDPDIMITIFFRSCQSVPRCASERDGYRRSSGVVYSTSTLDAGILYCAVIGGLTSEPKYRTLQ